METIDFIFNNLKSRKVKKNVMGDVYEAFSDYFR